MHGHTVIMAENRIGPIVMLMEQVYVPIGLICQTTSNTPPESSLSLFPTHLLSRIVCQMVDICAIHLQSTAAAEVEDSECLRLLKDFIPDSIRGITADLQIKENKTAQRLFFKYVIWILISM